MLLSLPFDENKFLTTVDNFSLGSAVLIFFNLIITNIA
jgi:hypothetical protein